MALLPGPGARVAALQLNWRLRPRDEGQEAEAERFRRKRAAPWKTGGSRKSHCGASGAAGGADTTADPRHKDAARGPAFLPSPTGSSAGAAGPSAEPAPSLRQPIGASARANLSPPSRPEPLRSGFAHILQVFCV